VTDREVFNENELDEALLGDEFNDGFFLLADDFGDDDFVGDVEIDDIDCDGIEDDFDDFDDALCVVSLEVFDEDVDVLVEADEIFDF